MKIMKLDRICWQLLLSREIKHFIPFAGNFLRGCLIRKKFRYLFVFENWKGGIKAIFIHNFCVTSTYILGKKIIRCQNTSLLRGIREYEKKNFFYKLDEKIF